MNSERRTWYLYPGRGLLELAEPIGRGASGSGRFRVGVEGGGIRDACQGAVGLFCVVRLSRFSLSVCRRGFQAV